MESKLLGKLVLPYAESVLTSLVPHCQRIEILGSLRRGKEFVGDVELLVIPKGFQQGMLFDSQPTKIAADSELINAIHQFNVVKGGLENHGHIVQSYGPRRIPFDLFVAGYENFGYQKVIRTGPHEHNVGFIIPMLKYFGYELKHAQIWKDEQLIPIPEEEDLYDLIKTPVIPPNERQFFTKTKDLK